MKNFILLGFFLCLVISCKSISVNNQKQRINSQKITLSAIGVDKKYPLEEKYKNTAIINYNYPLKVSATPISFTKRTYKAFTEAKKFQEANFNLNYTDSIPQKPKFIYLQVIDRVQLINALNAEYNKKVKNYLKVKPEAQIIMGLSIALPSKDIEDINNAQKIFIEQNGLKSHILNLYRSGEVFKSINFDDGVVFTYKTGIACWQENRKHQLIIVDIVDGENDCPSKTYKKAKRAKKKINYFKL